MHAISRPVGDAVAPVREDPVVTTTSWELHAQLPLQDWLGYGRRLGTLGRSVNWWIGDWLRYGNARYGERYTRASRVTGYDPQSLMNMVYVASRFSAQRRRADLSWSHHAQLASLEEPEQERWLEFASEQRLSVHSLRLELRAWRQAERTHDDERASASTAEDREAMVCPNCNHIFGPDDGDGHQLRA